MTTEQMECPECGEDAVNAPTTDRVPWAAHGMERPQWSHKDGSSLCPALGDSGYAPAQPQPRATERQTQAEAEVDPGPTERQLDDWNIHNDHVDGLTAEYDRDREA